MAKADKLNRFNLSLPESWEDQSVYFFKGPEDSGVQHTLTLVVDKTAGESVLADFARERIDKELSTIQGAEILKEEEKQLPNGNPAYEVVLKWIPVDDKIIFRKEVFLILNGVGYSFAANFSKKTIKTIGVEVDQIINSFAPVSI
jgi:hypothetical protein